MWVWGWVCVRMCVCVCVHVHVSVNYHLILHKVQTRDKFLCMILAWTINKISVYDFSMDNKQSYFLLKTVKGAWHDEVL